MTAADLQRATQLVDDEGGQRFAFDVFSDDDQGLAALGDLLEQGKQVFHRADLLLVDQDVGILQSGFHALGIGNEVGREVAAVELHAFDDIQLGFEGLRLFHGDDAVFADLLHGLGNDAADGFIVVGGNGADLGDHVAADRLGELVEFTLATLAGFLVDLTGDGGDGPLDAALHGHGIGSGSHGLHAFTIDGLGQDSGGGGAIAGHVGGLRGDFAHHLRAHVFEGVFEFDFLGYGDAVFGDGGRTEFLLNHDVAALGTERDLHGVGQKVDAAENRLS